MDWSFIDSTILALVLIAYFIKGFSGFGPALILIPVIAIFYDPHTALLMSGMVLPPTSNLPGTYLFYLMRISKKTSIVITVLPHRLFF